MLFQKDELSKFDFISLTEFLFAFILMFVSTMISFLILPVYLKQALPAYKYFFDSHYFGLLIFLLSAALSFYIIYYFCCKRKQRTLKDGLFLYTKSRNITLLSILIGIVMPLLTLPIIFKFAPKEFYAMDLVQTKDGLVYLLTSALFAPFFEEVFYRGFVFPFFQSKLNSFWAVIITSLFFGSSHFMNIGTAHILVSIFIFYGLVLTLIRYFTNSLIPPMIAHFFHNLTLVSCFLLISAKQ